MSRPHSWLDRNWLWVPAGSMLGFAALVGVWLAAIGPVPPACAGGSTKGTGMRFLLVSATGTAPTHEAWRAALAAEGVPHDVFVAAEQQPLTRSELVAKRGRGRYQAVVLESATAGLAPDELAELADYERDFGVRRVTAYAAAASGKEDLDGERARVTASGRRTFSYLKGTVPIEGAAGYPTRLGSDASARALVATRDGRSLVTEKTHPDGRKELLVTVATQPGQLHQRLLAHGLIGWAGGGARLGLGRSYFSVQVDDVLLPNARWDELKNTSAGALATRAVKNPVRMKPKDFARAAAWSKRERFTLDLGFNGYGVGSDCDAPSRASIDHAEDFRWFNHTYSHLNLDELDEKAIVEQIDRNVTWARERGIDLDREELVTGEHSGLENPNLPPALAATDIRYLASDASRTPESIRLGPARTVPRHPTDIYFDAPTRRAQVDEYNHRYHEQCTGTGCLKAPIGWKEYLDRESRRILALVLASDPRPHYTHQSNLAEDATQHDVLSAVLRRYRSLVSLPLAQPTLTEAGELLLRMKRFTAAMQAGRVSAVRAGGKVYLKSKARLLVPVTGTGGGDAYGAERSGWVELRPGATLELDEVSNGG